LLDNIHSLLPSNWNGGATENGRKREYVLSGVIGV